MPKLTLNINFVFLKLLLKETRKYSFKFNLRLVKFNGGKNHK